MDIPKDTPVELADLPNRSLLVLYGSETGNSRDTAEELGRMAQRLHFKTLVEEMDLVTIAELQRFTLVILVISTTGQGDMPQNSLKFWRSLLRKRLSPTCLASVKFTSFGLGDSSYPRYNWAARKLHKRVLQLGATEFYPRGEGDEQDEDGIDQTFIRWSMDLRIKILEQYPLPQSISPIPDEALLPLRYRLDLSHADWCENEPTDFEMFNLAVPGEVSAVLIENQRVTPADHWQDVRRLTFEIRSPSSVGIRPGDCLRIYARNPPDDVQILITLMRWEKVADLPLDLAASPSLPSGLYSRRITTLRRLLTENLDIMAIPRRSFLEAIAHLSTNSDHKERLIEFTKSEYIDEYYDYATRPRRSILEVLQEFHSVQIPPEYVLEIFPVIRGRDFSIAGISPSSSNVTENHRVEILAALVKYRTVLRKIRVGLCSRYLAAMEPGAQILASHKPSVSHFDGPESARRPLCVLATGTGIAPARALIQERLGHQATGAGAGPTLLFFGNRSRERDFFFRDEWASIQSDSFHVFTAFSRDQQQKVYIQDVLRQQAKAVAKLARQNPIFLVCGGSSKMAMACREAIIDSFVEEGVCGTAQDAQAYFAGLTWCQEIW